MTFTQKPSTGAASEFIDRAARAAYEAYYANTTGLGMANWDNEGETAKGLARAQVRAVLEAIREPTVDMIVAGGDHKEWGRKHFGDPDYAPSGNIYTAMIEAALKDPT